MGRFVLLVAFTVLATTVYAEDDWEYVVSGNKEDVYMKTASVKVNDDFYNSVDAWVKYETIADKSYVVAKIQYYCKSDSFKKLEDHSYDRNGDYLGGRTKSGNIQHAIPDTIGVDLTEAACLSGALSELIKFHYMDNEDITDEHYREVIKKFGEYAMPAMLYYNEKTGNTN